MTPIPNTFGVRAFCRQIVVIPRGAVVLPNERWFCAGSGSNVLWTGDFDGILLRSGDEGVELLSRTQDKIRVRVGAGKPWHDFVRTSLELGGYGLENLALIPGTVGAAVVQNVGAYGVELKDRLHSVRVLNLETGAFFDFSAEECRFDYRESVFKHERNYFVVSATFELDRKYRPVLSYPDLRERFADGVPTAYEAFEAVCEIRRRKLPDPSIVGNAGSFFKNPVVSRVPLDYVGPVFPATDGKVKISAARLIESAGWKGKSMGRAGVSPGHALVLINLGGADGTEIARLAAAVRRSVFERFGVALENEVIVAGSGGLLPLEAFE